MERKELGKNKHGFYEYNIDLAGLKFKGSTSSDSGGEIQFPSIEMWTEDERISKKTLELCAANSTCAEKIADDSLMLQAYYDKVITDADLTDAEKEAK